VPWSATPGPWPCRRAGVALWSACTSASAGVRDRGRECGAERGRVLTVLLVDPPWQAGWGRLQSRPEPAWADQPGADRQSWRPSRAGNPRRRGAATRPGGAPGVPRLCTISRAESEDVVDGFLLAGHPEWEADPPARPGAGHRRQPTGFFVARLRRFLTQPGWLVLGLMSRDRAHKLGPECPGCGEPWLAGRPRCRGNLTAASTACGATSWSRLCPKLRRALPRLCGMSSTAIMDATTARAACCRRV